MRTLKHLKFLRLFLVSSLLTGGYAHAQVTKGGVGIGTKKPDQSAILDLSSTNKGLLLPRMSIKERSSIQNPASGLMVYQTDALPGIYVFNGTAWNPLSTSTEARLQVDSEAWSVLGNSGLNSAAHFIGSTDTTALVFKVNNERSGLLDYRRGNTFFGYKSAFANSGYNSVVIGSLAMQKPTISGNNVSIGFQSMFGSERGDHNVAVGSGSLAANITGERNTSIGSLAGYKSTGSGNVFIGFQSGYFENTNNKLHISNDINRAPLIFGDFENGRVGINTAQLLSVFNINGITNHSSGLRFEKMNSNSPSVAGNGKVLTVNQQGEVILVNDYFVPAPPTFWTENNGVISNSNHQGVKVNGAFETNGIGKFNGIEVGSGGFKITGLGNPSGKFLSLDGNGKLSLVNAPASTVAPASNWNLSGSFLSNSQGNVKVNNGMQLGFLNSSSETSPSNNKVLSVDGSGNIILVNDQVGSGHSGTGSSDGIWSVSETGQIVSVDKEINLYRNLGVDATIFARGILVGGLTVSNLGFRLSSFSSNNAPGPSNGKVLTVDENGQVYLTTDQNTGSGGGTAVTDGLWQNADGNIATTATQKVIIGSGINSLPNGFRLYVKEGILAERVKVAVANSEKWADYVFSPSYKLMPIKDVKEFIEKNKHLPNVPSASEVAENGLDLAEISAKQMEKIEELTLYLIQANERIEALEKKIKTLEK